MGAELLGDEWWPLNTAVCPCLQNIYVIFLIFVRVYILYVVLLTVRVNRYSERL
jgi:hypothetical protein